MQLHNNDILTTTVGSFFWKVTAYPKIILTITVFAIFGATYILPKITKDTSSESFMPNDHPAVVYREKVKDIFGLADPVVVAVVNNGLDLDFEYFRLDDDGT